MTEKHQKTICVPRKAFAIGYLEVPLGKRLYLGKLSVLSTAVHKKEQSKRCSTFGEKS